MMSLTCRKSTLAGTMVLLSILVPSRWGVSQEGTAVTKLMLEVPADARVVINDHETRSTGTARSFVSYDLTPGYTYTYRVRVIGRYQGNPWNREETIYLEHGQTKQLVFRYGDLPREERFRVSVPDSRARTAPTNNGRRDDPQAPATDLTQIGSASVLHQEEPPAILPPGVEAEDAGNIYLAVKFEDLHLTGGDLPPEFMQPVLENNFPTSFEAWATVDDGGEAYVYKPRQASPMLVLRTSRRDKVTGQLLLPSISAQQTVCLSYTAIPDDWQAARNIFYQVKRDYYERRLAAGSTGREWFRHQIRSTDSHLPANGRRSIDSRSTSASAGNYPLANWYGFMTGSQAVNENLNLEANQPSSTGHVGTIPVGSIRGINVPAINWEPLLPKKQPALDPLAAMIPADQHAVFFPSIQQASKLAEQATDGETVFMRLLDAQTVHWRIQERYEQQFGMPLSELITLLDSGTSASVALTGSDPQVAMGTDVAIVIESPEPIVLAQQLVERISKNAEGSGNVQVKSWKSPAMTAIGVASPDRRICSYVATLPGAVVLTNSTYQLQCLSDVQLGREASLATLPEFVFFRDRYRLDDPLETALVVISDATIRRWGSPRWRIGQVRRLSAAAALSQWQAQWGQPRNRLPLISLGVPLSAGLDINDRGVYSRDLGSLDFMTPVSESRLDLVTVSERAAYETWRNTYERSWVQFDPIAMRLAVQDRRLDVDLTVMPLTLQTDYIGFRSLTQGAFLHRDAGDPHDSCLELAIALNKESPSFKWIEMMASGLFRQGNPSAGIDPLKWFDGMVTIYLDADPAWETSLRERGGLSDFGTPALLASLVQAPLGIQFEATSGLELTKFLVGLRSFIEISAPGMLKWELREYRGRSYTKISVSEILKERDGNRELTNDTRWLDDAAIYYTVYGDALVITLNEKVLQRAIDRRITNQTQPQALIPAGDRESLGDNLAVHVDAKSLQLLTALAGDERCQAFMQSQSWSNLPILNDLKRLHPNQNPSDFFERLWNARPVCPGGGDYVWNETWKTIESTVYGHPAAPKTGPNLPDIFCRLADADAGLTFENNGLRTRFTLQWSQPEKDSDPRP